MSEETDKKRGRWVIGIFIVVAIVTIAGTLITNITTWRGYYQTEQAQGIAPEDATPLPREVPGQAAPTP